MVNDNGYENKSFPGPGYIPCSNARSINVNSSKWKKEFMLREERRKKDIESGMPLGRVMFRYWHWPIDEK